MPSTDPPTDGRYRGVLTPKDEEFLLGEEELDANARRNARFRMRERIKNNVRDFQVLLEQLPESDREQIFTDLIESDTESLESLLSFIYLGTKDFTSPSASSTPNPLFERLVERAVQDIEHEYEYGVSACQEETPKASRPSMDLSIDRRVRTRSGKGLTHTPNHGENVFGPSRFSTPAPPGRTLSRHDLGQRPTWPMCNCPFSLCGIHQSQLGDFGS